MPETPDAGRRLSLGLYSERSRAERRVQAVRQAGLSAEIAERRLPGTLYWVDLTPLPGASTIPLQGLVDGGSARIAVQPCLPAAAASPPTVATGQAVTRTGGPSKLP